jgi:hypothetical protein
LGAHQRTFLLLSQTRTLYRLIRTMVNISIVLHSPEWCRVQKLVTTLMQAETVKNIYLIDNSTEEAERDTRYRIKPAAPLFYAQKPVFLVYGRRIFLYLSIHFIVTDHVRCFPRPFS